jgi:hypothetical protein
MQVQYVIVQLKVSMAAAIFMKASILKLPDLPAVWVNTSMF